MKNVCIGGSDCRHKKSCGSGCLYSCCVLQNGDLVCASATKMKMR
ncbi:MAG: hypothetical protein ACLTDX_06610 [[Clostridium] innocuum]